MISPPNRHAAPILVLGIGNRLMTDDAAGPIAIERLSGADLPGTRVIDGGTCGLTLLPEIEACGGLIVIDAAQIGAEPGTVRVVEGTAMDALMRGPKQTAHEVALCDLLDAAACTTGRPALRALVAIQPGRVAVGYDPTPAVAAAIPAVCDAVRATLDRWQKEEAA